MRILLQKSVAVYAVDNALHFTKLGFSRSQIYKMFELDADPWIDGAVGQLIRILELHNKMIIWKCHGKSARQLSRSCES